MTSSAALLLAGVTVRPAVIAGIALVPVGEFSFVLGRGARDAGLVSPEMSQILLGMAVITMIAAPALVALGPTIAQALGRRLGSATEPAEADAARALLTDHVIILGFGMGGRLIADAMRGIGTAYVALELNGATVRKSSRTGDHIVYGDATSPEALRGVGVERARAVVGLLSDPDASLRAIQAVRQIAPDVPIIVRARYRGEADRFQRAGATLAVAEELEASLEVLAQLLSRLHVAGNVVESLLETFRRETIAGRKIHAPALPLGDLPDAIRRSPIASHRLHAGDWAVGRTLAEIDLRATTGATVLAIASGDRYLTAPPADARLEAEDVLYLVGDSADVRLARSRLGEGTGSFRR